MSVPQSEEASAPEVEPEPSGFRTLLRRGNRRFKKGDHVGAVELFTQALDTWDRSAVAFANRGAAFYMQKDYPRAVADFDSAIAIDPDHAPAYRRRGRAHFKSRDFAAAVEDFTEVIRLHPDDPDAYHKRGVAYFRTGAKAKAAADEDRARLLAWGPVSGVDEEPSEELGDAVPPRGDPQSSAPVTVLTLEGVLDHSTSEALEELLHQLVVGGHSRILADAAGLTYIGSRSASLFLAMLRPLRLAGGDLKFCRLVERARTVFTTLGLAELIELDFDARDPALRAFDRPLPQVWLDALREGWVGLVTSSAYHRPTCVQVKVADPVFQVWFESEDEAVLAGRKPCSHCC